MNKYFVTSFLCFSIFATLVILAIIILVGASAFDGVYGSFDTVSMRGIPLWIPALLFLIAGSFSLVLGIKKKWSKHNL